MESRRNFLKALLGVVAGTIIAPITHKKTPGKKKIVLLETYVAGFQYYK